MGIFDSDQTTQGFDEGEGLVHDTGGPQPSGQPPQDTDSDKILGKFKSEDALRDGFDNLAAHLGMRGLTADQFQSTDDLIEGYRELERRQGGKGQQPQPLQQNMDIPQQTPEQDMTRYQLEQQQAQLQQMAQYIQAMYAQQQQGPQNPQQDAGQSSEPQIDPAEWMDKFYDNPMEALSEAIRPLIDKEAQELGQVLNQYVMTPMQQLQQKHQEEQLAEYYMGQVRQLEQKYPDFNDVKGDMAKYYQSYPQLYNMENGLELAYQMASAERVKNNQYQRSTQTQKMAARMPGSQGRVADRPQSNEEYIRNQIFGTPGKPGGIFG